MKECIYIESIGSPQEAWHLLSSCCECRSDIHELTEVQEVLFSLAFPLTVAELAFILRGNGFDSISGQLLSSCRLTASAERGSAPAGLS